MVTFLLLLLVKQMDWQRTLTASFLGWLLGLAFERDFPFLSQVEIELFYQKPFILKQDQTLEM